MIRGGVGFAVVSTAAFAVWAFGEGWFAQLGGEAGMYAACCVVFILLSGLVLRPLLGWPGTLLQFYRFFFTAFLAYATAWCAGWFSLGMGAGEWLGALVGCTAFTAVMAATLNGWRMLLPSALVMFAFHSAGYFAGAHVCYSSLHSVGSELAWGALYGLGLGAGIGSAFAMMRQP
ncbi:hypothetical protein [Prosthecobacter sp.]|uniref:hypothetical protein n=1 Tax=Prosthecobacter sp. TaxID=1965333 RepID=UPI0037837485